MVPNSNPGDRRTFLLEIIIVILTFTIFGMVAMGQNVGINTTGAAPHASAILDLSSTSSGFLTPRMTMAQRNSITTPATGLLIYQTDNTPGFYYYNGTGWTAFGADTDWLTNASGMYSNTNPVGIGTTTPNAGYDLTVGTLGAKIEGYLKVDYDTETQRLHSEKVANPFGRDTLSRFRLTGSGIGVAVLVENMNSGPALEVQARTTFAGDTGIFVYGHPAIVADGGTYGVMSTGDSSIYTVGTTVGIYAEGATNGVYGTASGTGYGGYFVKGSNGGYALGAASNGTGVTALQVNSLNGANTSPTVSVNHSGTGSAVHIVTSGAGQGLTIENVLSTDTMAYLLQNHTSTGFFLKGNDATMTQDLMKVTTKATAGSAAVFETSAGASTADVLVATNNSSAGRAFLSNGNARMSPVGAGASIDFIASGTEPGFLPSTNNWGQLGTSTQRLWDMHINSITYYGTLTNASDQRLKENIQPLKGGLEAILQLNPVTYDYSRSSFGAAHSGMKMTQIDEMRRGHAGLLAQDLEQILPDLVVKDEDSGYLSVNYLELISYLIEGMQTQQQQIQELRQALQNK